MIEILDLRDKDCEITRVDFNVGVDIMIEDANGDLLHLIFSHAQAEKLVVATDQGLVYSKGA